MTDILKLSSISKSYFAKPILENISFSIQEGEIFGLIGLNGIGKTTIIKIILDLVQADGGEVFIHGKSKQSIEARGDLIYLPEQFYPSPFLKGREFLQLVLELYKETYNKSVIKELAEKIDFPYECLDMYISKYSKGMAQKLGLISIFASQRSLLILDEPMSGLDPAARSSLKTLFKLHQKQKRTIFFTSHILTDIAQLCSNIAILHDKKLAYLGPVDSLVSSNQDLEEIFLSFTKN